MTGSSRARRFEPHDAQSVVCAATKSAPLNGARNLWFTWLNQLTKSTQLQEDVKENDEEQADRDDSMWMALRSEVTIFCIEWNWNN